MSGSLVAPGMNYWKRLRGLAGERPQRRFPCGHSAGSAPGSSRAAASMRSALSISRRRREAVVALFDQRRHVQAGQIVVLAPDDLDADGQALRQPDRCDG